MPGVNCIDCAGREGGFFAESRELNEARKF